MINNPTASQSQWQWYIHNKAPEKHTELIANIVLPSILGGGCLLEYISTTLAITINQITNVRNPVIIIT